MRLKLHEKLSLAGRKGGITTLERYGPAYYAALGQNSGGGRPRILNYSELKRLEASRKIEMEKEGS